MFGVRFLMLPLRKMGYKIDSQDVLSNEGEMYVSSFLSPHPGTKNIKVKDLLLVSLSY